MVDNNHNRTRAGFVDLYENGFTENEINCRYKNMTKAIRGAVQFGKDDSGIICERVQFLINEINEQERSR